MNVFKLIVLILLVSCSYQKEPVTSEQNSSRNADRLKVKRTGKIIGQPEVVHVFRSKSKDAIIVNVHYYVTKGGGSIKDHRAYLVIDGKKYRNLVQDGFRTESQIEDVMSCNDELIFFKTPHDIPKIPTLEKVQFVYTINYNGDAFEIDEVVKIHDIDQDMQKP